MEKQFSLIVGSSIWMEGEKRKAKAVRCSLQPTRTLSLEGGKLKNNTSSNYDLSGTHCMMEKESWRGKS
jgi:hypothetical protein